MNIETGPSKKDLDFGEVMQSLHSACQTDISFSGLSRQMIKEIICEPDLEEIPKYLSWRRAPAGSFLWQEGDADNSLALIVSGQVSLMKETGYKDKRIVVGIYNPITLIGEISFIDGHCQALTAKATQDTEMFVLSRENFSILKEEYPHIGKKTVRGLLHLFSVRQRMLLGRMSAIL